MDVVVDGLTLAEAPRWRDGKLWFFVCTNTGSGPAMAEKTDGRTEAIRVDTPGAGWP
jgi:hypothetical protein